MHFFTPVLIKLQCRATPFSYKRYHWHLPKGSMCWCPQGRFDLKRIFSSVQNVKHQTQLFWPGGYFIRVLRYPDNRAVLEELISYEQKWLGLGLGLGLQGQGQGLEFRVQSSEFIRASTHGILY